MSVVRVNDPSTEWGPWFHNKWGDGTCVREGRNALGKVIYDVHSIINGDDVFCREADHAARYQEAYSANREGE